MAKQNPSFEESMKESSLWCSAWERDELSDEVLADKIDNLLSTGNGVRGFFAVSLPSESPLMDRLPEALIYKLREARMSVIDITAKNLAMSSAMAFHHKRNKSKIQSNGSQKVQRRCIELLRALDPHLVKERLERLLRASEGEEGEDLNFLNRWNYDDEQKREIALGINLIAENKKNKKGG